MITFISALSKTDLEFNGNQNDWKHFARTRELVQTSNFFFFPKDTTIKEKHQGVSMAISSPPPTESSPAAGCRAS